jgi:tetratricopeptide (TPR) repeat protein
MNKIMKYCLAVIIIITLFSNYAFSQDNVEKGKNAVKKGDYLTALNLLKSVVAKDNGYDANCYYGIALMKTGSLDESQKYLKIALKDDDEGIEALNSLGELYTLQKKYSDADDLFRKALKLEPESISTMLLKAANYSAEGKIDKAIEVLTLATTVSKENPAVYVGLGDAYYIRGSYKLAKEYLDKAVKLNSKLAPAHYVLGKVYFKMKKYNESLTSFNTALAKDENFADAYLEKGKILYFNATYPEAAYCFKKYSQLKPGSQEGNSYYAKTLYAEGKYDDALKILSEVLKADPKSYTGNLYTAYIYSEREQTDSLAQVEQYQKSVEYFSKVPIKDFEIEDLIKYAKVNIELRNFDDAYSIFDKAIKMDSTDTRVYYEYGKAYFKQGNFENALKYLNNALDLGLKEKYVYLFRGLTQYYLGEKDKSLYEKALADFQECVRIDEKYIIAYNWMAKCYFLLGKSDESIKTYEKVLTIDPENAEAKDKLARMKVNNKNN